MVDGTRVEGPVFDEWVSFEREVCQAREREGDPRFADLDDDALVEAVRLGAVEVAAATCRWLLLVAELVVRGVWAREGARTPAQWLSWAVSMAPSTAREHVRVALRLVHFPQTAERFARGELSYSKVRAITRLGLPELEPLLLRYAESATGGQLEDIVRGMQAVRRRAARAAVDPYERRSAWWEWADDGAFELRVRLAPEEGVAVAEQMEAAADRLVVDARRAAAASAEAAGEDPGPPRREALRADAVVEAFAALAEHGPAAGGPGDTRTVVIHTDAAALDPLPAGEDRPVAVGASAGSRTLAMSARAVRRLACDARLAVVAHDDDGDVTAVSGTTRRVPPRLRRLLFARDGGCRFPSCGSRRWLHAHHIVHWADGGPTEAANLVLLCGYHHRFVHEREWSIIHDGRGHVRFRPPQGAVEPRRVS